MDYDEQMARAIAASIKSARKEQHAHKMALSASPSASATAKGGVKMPRNTSDNNKPQVSLDTTRRVIIHRVNVHSVANHCGGVFFFFFFFFCSSISVVAGSFEKMLRLLQNTKRMNGGFSLSIRPDTCSFMVFNWTTKANRRLLSKVV